MSDTGILYCNCPYAQIINPAVEGGGAAATLRLRPQIVTDECFFDLTAIR